MARPTAETAAASISSTPSSPGSRYYVTRGADRRKITSKLLADLSETDTGDPKVLEDFIRFGARSFPAKACALILSNHGSGF